MNIRDALSYDDVLLVPKHGILEKRIEADISGEIVPGWTIDVPIVSANMPSVASPNLVRAMYESGGIGTLHRFYTWDLQSADYQLAGKLGIPSIGLETGLETTNLYFEKITNYPVTYLLDVAHGDHEQVINFIREWKFHFGAHAWLIAGNVATYDAANRLATEGVDAIKVGIGPGAACTTRETTGFGVPQLSAVLDASKIKEDFEHVRIIADGGIKNSGDIVKALAAGADTVMIGSLLAGADEAPEPGVYYGSASKRMNGHHAPEGAEGTVLRSGSVSDIIKKLAWGIRSGISYGGATNVQELRDNAEWVRVTPQAMLENGVRLQ